MKINSSIFVLMFLSMYILPVSQVNAEDKICDSFQIQNGLYGSQIR